MTHTQSEYVAREPGPTTRKLAKEGPSRAVFQYLSCMALAQLQLLAPTAWLFAATAVTCVQFQLLQGL